MIEQLMEIKHGLHGSGYSSCHALLAAGRCTLNTDGVEKCLEQGCACDSMKPRLCDDGQQNGSHREQQGCRAMQEQISYLVCTILNPLRPVFIRLMIRLIQHNTD